MGVHEEVDEERLQLTLVAEDEARDRSGRDPERQPFLLEGRLEELDRFAQRLADVEAVLGRTGGPREPAEALDEPLHALDLARDDPAEVLEERMVVEPARDELGERLDGHDRVLDLVGDAGSQDLEVGQSLHSLALGLQLLERREVTEHRDRAQDGAPGIAQGRGRADHRAGRRPGVQHDLRRRPRLPVLERRAQQRAQDLGQPAHGLAPDRLGPQRREALRRPIEHGDAPRRVHRHHPALDGGHDVFHVLVGEHDLGVELGVLDRDPRLIGQRHQQVQIVGIERVARTLGADGDRSDHRVFEHHRKDQCPIELDEMIVHVSKFMGAMLGDFICNDVVVRRF